MIRARAWIALAGWLVFGVSPVACQRSRPVKKNAGVEPVVAIFKDTGQSVNFPAGRDFGLRTPGQRDSLRAVLRRERESWRAVAPRDYRFLLRTGCFCPGQRGWLVMEVRSGQPLRAWARAGKAVPSTDWNTFSIEGLFDSLERSAAELDGAVKVDFDPRWHFPR